MNAANISKITVDLLVQFYYSRIKREEEGRSLATTPVTSGRSGPPGRRYLPGGPVCAGCACLPGAFDRGRAEPGHLRGSPA